MRLLDCAVGPAGRYRAPRECLPGVSRTNCANMGSSPPRPARNRGSLPTMRHGPLFWHWVFSLTQRNASGRAGALRRGLMARLIAPDQHMPVKVVWRVAVLPVESVAVMVTGNGKAQPRDVQGAEGVTAMYPAGVTTKQSGGSSGG